jgi:acyl-CoA synthetase (AMP-forming)/AMP-acid ligase II
MPLDLTIPNLIFNQGQRDEVIAIEGGDGRGIAYGALREQVHMTVGALNSMGFRRNDRIAVVLPEDTYMAVAAICLVSGFTLVPLSPYYQEAEYRMYLADLKPKAVLIGKGSGHQVRDAANALSFELLELMPAPEPWTFQISGCQWSGKLDPVFASAEDDAVIFSTSGTTAKPKLIPLTHSNTCHNLIYGIRGMGLTPEDRFLHFLPPFHLAGFDANGFMLAAGGTVANAPAYAVAELSRLVDSFHPTMLMTTPPQNQMLIDLLKKNPGIASRLKLRILVTGGGYQTPKVKEELESILNAPVLDYYGMTEAGGVCSGPLPPRQRKAGSVGPSHGPEVAIIDAQGNLLPTGEIGEIGVRGGSVMRGYLDNPEANAKAFVKGWFRTGDLGYLDGEGYLFIKGRVKDIINRGSEKIAPSEIDYVLQQHPAVAEAVAFPVSHPTLGEDMNAAVVVREREQVTEAELRSFLFERLAYFKVPTRIIFVEEIPKVALGKASRREIALALGFGFVD